MAGNAYEWVADWYAEDYYWQAGDDVGMGWYDPTGPVGPDVDPASRLMLKSVRGGAYLSAPEALFTFRRFAWHPSLRSASIGFRCAKTYTPD